MHPGHAPETFAEALGVGAGGAAGTAGTAGPYPERLARRERFRSMPPVHDHIGRIGLQSEQLDLHRHRVLEPARFFGEHVCDERRSRIVERRVH